MALATAGLACVVFGLIEGQRYDWGTVAGSLVTIPEAMIAGAVRLAAFAFWERSQRGREPLLPPALLRNPGSP
jgi:hypothetical protein